MEKNELIITYLQQHQGVSSTEIFEEAGLVVAYATVRRELTKLVAEGLVTVEGKGRASRYSLSPLAKLFARVNIETYFEKEIDQRNILPGYNFELIDSLTKTTTLFSTTETEQLQELQKTFRKNIASLSKEQYRAEMERLGIDLSWKSAQIEGNTYSLLETERLLKEQQTAAGKTRDEATMLLNHKAALDFILSHEDFLKELTVANIETVHSLLIRDLPVERNIRQRRVGITGTAYRPLDNEFQIREALEATCALVNSRKNVFDKALLVLLLLSYIQPFADGNKRTARIVSNAVLIAEGSCPLSFRSVDSMDYKKAMLVFYELNNLSPFKQIFIDQFSFAVSTYF